MYSTVLLDAGGVILDESEYEKQTCRIISEILHNQFGSYSEQNYYLDLEESINRFSPHNRQYIIWKYCNNDIRLFKSIWEEFNGIWKQNRPSLSLMKGISNELHDLKARFKIILAGQYGIEIIELLRRNSLLDLFENEYSQDDYRLTKPDPRYFNELCNRAGITGSECIMVGDRIDKDVIPGKQNNMATVFVKSGVYKNQKARTHHEVPDLILDSTDGMGKNLIKVFG